MRDAGAVPLRCHKGPIRAALAAAVRALANDDLGGTVRPWDLSALRRRAATLGAVSAVRAVRVDETVLIAELAPGGQRLVLRGVDDGWRLVRFAEPDETDIVLTPEITEEIALSGWGPDAVLQALGVHRPDGVDLDVESEYLGQGETRTVWRYLFTDGGRSVLAEEVKSELFDGATPSSSCLRGVLIDGAHGVLLTGTADRTLLIRG